jgi:hypothetical protein
MAGWIVKQHEIAGWCVAKLSRRSSYSLTDRTV